MSASVMAHPIEQLYPVSQELRSNYTSIVECDNAITQNMFIDQKCEYVAKTGAGVLEILVSSLEYENVPVLRANRKELRSIAWENLSLWEIGYGWWVLDDARVKRTTKYLGKHRPDLIRPYLSNVTYNKLKEGNFID